VAQTKLMRQRTTGELLTGRANELTRVAGGVAALRLAEAHGQRFETIALACTGGSPARLDEAMPITTDRQ
jgi:hypothetical protein